jgi:hypothetical protein
MRGYAEHNFPAFREAAQTLRRYGVQVVSPAEKDLQVGFDPTRPVEEQGFDLKAALRWDLEQVLEVDAVVLLPGWEESFGAQAEANLARAVGTPVHEYEDLVEDALLARTMVGQFVAFRDAFRNLATALAESGTRIAEFLAGYLDRVPKAHPSEVECVPGAHDDDFARDVRFVGPCRYCRAAV